MQALRITPLPTSPTRGEVKVSVCGTMVPNPPARHLPLDGGGWEGVSPRTALSAANDNLAPKRANEEQSHG
jgi:hypothetical protein